MNHIQSSHAGTSVSMTPAPETIDAKAVLAWAQQPLLAAQVACARRHAFGRDTIRILPIPAHRRPDVALRVCADGQGGGDQTLAAWPQAQSWAADDQWVVQVDATAEAQVRFVAWLDALRTDALPPSALAVCCSCAAGLHPLWATAAARCLLPAQVSIHARHDLLGIRVAQLALGFGADTLAGPITPDRSLPLCGVPRPDEGTMAGLVALVRHAGLQPAPVA